MNCATLKALILLIICQPLIAKESTSHTKDSHSHDHAHPTSDKSEDKHKGKHNVPIKSLKAHVHDHALMQIVTSGNQVHVNLEIPGENIYGFEHQPKTEEQKKIVKDKHDWLNKTAKDFLKFKDQLCEAYKTTIESTLDSNVAQMRHDHAELKISVNYNCKRGVKDAPVTIEVLNHTNLKQIRVSVLNEKLPFSKTVTTKSFALKI